MNRFKRLFTPSRTSPKSRRRGCLCRDRDAYSIECCNGDIIAQGIGSTSKNENFILLENGNFLLQENNFKIER